jgi:hypothetical protein
MICRSVSQDSRPDPNIFAQIQRILAATVLCLAVTFKAPDVARAGFICELVEVTDEFGMRTFIYVATIIPDQKIVPPPVPLPEPLPPTLPDDIAFFTIYDFSGLISGSQTGPADWAALSLFVGPNGVGTIPADDPTIPNISWVYTGDTIVIGPTVLGTFTARSTASELVLGNFSGQAAIHRPGTPEDGVISGNVGFVEIPRIPEPGSVFLLGIGVVGLVLARRLFLMKNSTGKQE